MAQGNRKPTLGVYTSYRNDKRFAGGSREVKTTMRMSTIANPRRTTLVHLDSAEEIAPQTIAGTGEGELPTQTANPRRTTLVDAPGA
jgi:hypothetical protein